MYGCINEYMINNVFSLCQRVCTKNLFMLANKEQRAQDFKYAKRNHQKHQSITAAASPDTIVSLEASTGTRYEAIPIKV